MSQPLILRIENITKHFAQSTAAAVEDLSLSLQNGEILALLGPSGCGKTTLLRMIAGFEVPQSGQIFLAEQPISTADICLPPERRDVGMVFQDYALFPHLTVRQNVAFGLKQWGDRQTKVGRAWQALTSEAIARVGLTGLENRFPHQLSGGQQQRVALARALAPCPPLILLDEPLSNLDIQVRLRLRQEIRDILKQAKLSAIFVTHDQEEALGIADQVAVMQRGKIEQIGTPEAIYATPKTRFVAEFVTQANFLPAQFQSGAWSTEIGTFQMPEMPPSLESISGENLSLTRSPHADSRVLMIRQEHLHLQPDPQSRVVVRDRQFLGRDYRYRLGLPSGQTLYALSPTRVTISIGTCVSVQASTTHMRLY